MFKNKILFILSVLLIISFYIYSQESSVRASNTQETQDDLAILEIIVNDQESINNLDVKLTFKEKLELIWELSKLSVKEKKDKLLKYISKHKVATATVCTSATIVILLFWYYWHTHKK
jgi:hypothetical protein